jgi:hypothetical protein
MRVAPFIAVLLAACVVNLPDEPGRACDETHPCQPGRECIAGICTDETGAGGGDAAGGGGQGGGTSGGGTPPGKVVWRQAADGFSNTQKFGSATITVKGDAGNEVTSRVLTPDDANDRACANQNNVAMLPATGNGHLRGRFRLPAPLALKASSTWLRLENGSSVVVSLQFNSSGALVVRSDTGFLGPTAYTQTVTWPGGFSANYDYWVDLTWTRGVARDLVINANAFPLSLSPPATALVTPDQLRLGIYRYDGDAGTAMDGGWSIILGDWALADDPSVPL